MKSHRKELWFNTTSRRQLLNITREIQEEITDRRIQDGLVLVNAMHI